jgi:hypothetical protein
MKTLKDHLILYDADCPMCKLYTRAFTASGMLDDEGRAPYQQMPGPACSVVNRQRAVNEIALINKTTGEVSYGIHSLFKIIGHSFPLFNPLFSFRPFIWLMSKFYAFISYNRKVIAPAAAREEGLTPSFRLDYRVMYLAVTWLATGCMLTAYARLLAGLIAPGSGIREYLIAGGQILFQGVVVGVYAPRKRWDYLGNMMTVSLAGAVLLSPVLVLSGSIHLSTGAAAVCFLTVAALMFLEHARRMKLMKLGWTLTITWAIYRLILLGLILS